MAPGGAAGAAMWMGGSVIYTWGLDHFAHFGVTYGSLGAILGLMLWLWFSSMAVLVGAELNAEIEHQTAQDTTVGGPRPLGERGAVMADTVGKASPPVPPCPWRGPAEGQRGKRRNSPELGPRGSPPDGFAASP